MLDQNAYSYRMCAEFRP